jgi:formylglycine-generating enzyme required for sulfatase activity
MRDAGRIVEIKGSKEGSGYLVAPCLILTAWHVVKPSVEDSTTRQVPVRIYKEYQDARGEARYQARMAEVIWPPSNSVENDDFALLVTKEETAPSDDPVDWVELSDNGTLKVDGIGFPESNIIEVRSREGEGEDFKERDTREIKGRVHLGSDLKTRKQTGVFEVVLWEEDLPEGSQQRWEGMSGAALFAGRDLIGIVTRVTQERGFHRLWGLSVDRIFGRDEVRKAIFKAKLRAPVFANFEVDPKLIEKIRNIGTPLRLRALLAFSSPGPGADDHVNSEISTITKTFHQNLVLSALKEYFDVDVFECLNAAQIRRVVSTKSDNSETLNLPSLGDFELVVIVAWHNLGDAGLNMRNLQREAQDLAEHDQAAHHSPLVYRREGEPRLAISDAQRDGIAQYEQVKVFFQDLEPDNGPLYTNYSKKDFSAIFEIDFWRVIKHFVERRQGANNTHSRPFENPYLGLRHYDENDAALFFGRAKEIEHLCDRFASGRDRFIAVVGASGSGKSSLVRAGLLYRLKRDVLPGSRDWEVIDFSLALLRGSPIDGLSNGLIDLFKKLCKKQRGTIAELDPEQLSSIGPLVEAVLARLPIEARLIFFIDQFEELFTRISDPAARNDLVHFLVQAVRLPQVYVLITLRADYYDHVLQFPELAEVLQGGVYSPPAPSHNSLLSIIRRPAIFSGLKFEEFEDRNLPLEILTEAGADSGTLPLLSYTLEQLASPARLGSDKVITRAALRELNGVRGAIQKKADEAIELVRDLMAARKIQFPEFDLEQSLRILFHHLVKLNERDNAARQPAPYGSDDPTWPFGARFLADTMVKQRLLRTDWVSNPDAQGGGSPIIEIAHEAVLNHWPRLQGWVDKYREALSVQRRVQESANDWKAARDKASNDLAKLKVDHELLWPDSRLEEAARMLGLLLVEPDKMSSTVKDFLRPERERLLDELNLPIDHSSRARVGDRLAELGDQRPGIGLRTQDKLPDIEWCQVPGGQVQIVIDPDRNMEFDVKPFYIAKYAVTLCQFDVFASSQAYRDEKWWETLPVRPSERTPVQQSPPVANHPADRVSWYQAVAYCRWLSNALCYCVRLPTEWEWQQAATGGRPGYLYPWGTEWTPRKANTKEGSVGRLLSVGMYPEGASPVGALDMSGNMYEWCQNEYDDPWKCEPNGTKPRTTRGGAYFAFGTSEARESVKVTARLRDNANGHNDRGDRIRVCIRLACDQPG